MNETLLNSADKVLSKTNYKEIVCYGSKKFTQGILLKNTDSTFEHFGMAMISWSDKNNQNLKNINTITQ